MSEKVYQGSCLCDGVRFTTHGEPDKVFACYCSDCLKNAGAPYQICSKMPRSAVHVSEGAEFLSTWVCKETASGHEKHKVFCSRCGCTLWTIPMHHKGEVYVVRSALLQAGLSTFKPSVELFASRRPEYLDQIQGTKAFDTMPGK